MNFGFGFSTLALSSFIHFEYYELNHRNAIVRVVFFAKPNLLPVTGKTSSYLKHKSPSAHSTTPWTPHSAHHHYRHQISPVYFQIGLILFHSKQHLIRRPQYYLISCWLNSHSMLCGSCNFAC